MIGRAYRIAQILSMDIAIGVVILLRFFCSQSGVNVGWEVYVLFGTTVWLIYTVDHLRDAARSKGSTRLRYVFHRQYKKPLVILSILVVILNTSLILFIPLVIFWGGVALAVFSFVYLLIQHQLSSFFAKELYAACVYSWGISMVPILLGRDYRWDIPVLLCLLTFVNLTLFSRYERAEDINDGFKSIATETGVNQLENIIFILISAGLIISLINFNLVNGYFATGFIIYALMIIKPDWFSTNHKYRTIGDSVFFLPILSEWL